MARVMVARQFNGSDMPKPPTRTTSRYANEAITYLGRLIREARIDRKVTAAQLAERAGISRGLLQRIERGDPGCSIGAVFETAAIVGIRLFDLDRERLVANNEALARTLTLLPRSARPAKTEVKDDF
jgi:transcriptional regulator with XRE-family HTH domain